MPRAKKTAPVVKQEVKKKVVAEKIDTSSYDKWTYDIRDEFKNGVTEKDLDEVESRLNVKGRTLAKLYCTDEQLSVVKTFKEYGTLELVTK